MILIFLWLVHLKSSSVIKSQSSFMQAIKPDSRDPNGLLVSFTDNSPFLLTIEFKALCESLNFRNPRNNRLLTGKNAIIEIEKLGYSVSNLTKNNKRYKYIEKS